MDYNWKEIEEKWQKKWGEEEIYKFKFDDGKPIYSIDNPPRYASGSIHIGHAVHYTHIDFIARYKRMRGYNVFFPLCFDVNGIPIEERVEKKLGITRKDIDRHKFVKNCEKFAEENISKMIQQFMRLGESMDPSIYYQTNAKEYRRLTQISFIQLYKKGYIYKDEFPVNWCPRCMTAMADAEIEHIDRETWLNTIKFYLVDEQPGIEKLKGIGKDENGQFVEIATTRPEMLPSCQLVGINPSDDRSSWLKNKTLRVPLFDKEVKIVEDESVDPSFGTGMVMVCTIGDKEDLEWVFKYDLPIEMCIDEEGKMTDRCGKYEGLPIKEAREAVIEDLKKKNMLIKKKELEQSVGVCWRCKTPVEFIQTKQWFLKMLPFKEKVLKAADEIKWYPKFMKLRLIEWVDSLKWDWVISRQRYFATPIPLWECIDCNEVVLAEPEQCYIDPTIDPIKKCPKCGGKLKGCEDVFDTWMDSSISPLYNSFWNRNEEIFKRMYPMSLRPQSHDIIRTWAFYTILRCLLLTHEPPFKKMMMGGFILAPDGKPMHTSLGNVIEPARILDKYGADALRYYAAKCTLGEDNPFRYKDVVRGQRFARKLWNIEKFISNAINGFNDLNLEKKMNEFKVVDRWILSLYSKLVNRCTDYMDEFNYSDAIREIEYFIWHEFADHYIEMVKHRIYEEKDENVIQVLYKIGLGIIKLLSPFLPHITEEIYNRNYADFEEDRSIHLSKWPTPILIDEKSEEKGEIIKKIVSEIRYWKSENGIALNASLPEVEIWGSKIKEIEPNVIKSTLNIENLEITTEMPEIEEVIADIKPDYSKIGPMFKEKSGKIIEWIENHGDEIAKEIEKKGEFSMPTTEPISKDYVKLEKKFRVKGKKIDLIKIDDIVVIIK